MNPWQLTQDMIYRLNPTNLKWGEGNDEAVLSRVIAAPAPPGFFRHDSVTPYALLQLESGRGNEEHPADLIEEARWSLYLLAGNATEQSGAAPVVGGNRVNLGSSRGRGLLEVEPLVQKAIFNATGLYARPRAISTRPPSIPDELQGLVVMRALEIVASRIPALPAYAPVQRLKSTAAGGGNVTLTWGAAPSRYDLVGYTWRRAAGSTAPSTPASGTFVESTTPSLSDSPGAGTWSYAIWWAFDATRDPFTGKGVYPVAANRWSSQQSSQAGLVYLGAEITVAA